MSTASVSRSARRLLAGLARLLSESPVEPRVHFHAGENGRPYACHDPRCRAPRLDVVELSPAPRPAAHVPDAGRRRARACDARPRSARRRDACSR